MGAVGNIGWISPSIQDCENEPVPLRAILEPEAEEKPVILMLPSFKISESANIIIYIVTNLKLKKLLYKLLYKYYKKFVISHEYIMQIL